jgi:hypothetical protein
MAYASFRYRSKKAGTCESCVKIHNKRNLLLDCDKCQQGYVEPLKENWEVIGLIETYGDSIFITSNDNGLCVNTNNIKNILEAEGFKGSNYSSMFHSLILFFTAAINRIYQDKEKYND